MISPRKGSVGSAETCDFICLKNVDRRLKIAELVLRWVVFLLGLFVTVLVGTDTQVREIFTVEKRARFTDMKALVYLLVANGMVSSYCLFQGVRCAVCMCKGSKRLPLNKKTLAWVVFTGDQVMAYATLAASAAATQSAVLSEKGQRQFRWMKLNSLYEKFCTQAGGGLVISYLGSVSIISLSCISAFHLFRLYGNEGRNKC